ncbi:uridine kinase family protein [Jatrophihabitans sp. DSM 45814]
MDKAGSGQTGSGQTGSAATKPTSSTEFARRILAIRRARPSCGAVTVVAIDGGAASGKTTLAAALAQQFVASATVHTDDLLNGWADQFGFWSRLREQVLRPLAAGRAGHYQRYDWNLGRFQNEFVTVPVVPTLFVEGVSAIEACASWSSYGVFIDVSRQDRELHWRRRDGELGDEARRWLDREDEYFASRSITADWVVQRGDSLP